MVLVTQNTMEMTREEITAEIKGMVGDYPIEYKQELKVIGCTLLDMKISLLLMWLPGLVLRKHNNQENRASSPNLFLVRYGGFYRGSLLLSRNKLLFLEQKLGNCQPCPVISCVLTEDEPNPLPISGDPNLFHLSEHHS